MKPCVCVCVVTPVCVTPPDKEEEDEPKLTCEYCGWVDFAYKFKGSKRFCSVVCAKRYVQRGLQQGARGGGST